MSVNKFFGGIMAAPPQFLYRDVLFHPPEADRLADRIAENIRKLIGEQSTIDSHINNLRSDWEGHQEEMFISDFNPHQKKSANLLEELRRQEQHFRSLQVTRREEYTNPAWEEYQRGKR
jgi:uncharacterized protein YukE